MNLGHLTKLPRFDFQITIQQQNKLQCSINQDPQLFIQENAFENVIWSCLIVLTAVFIVPMILVSNLQPVSVVSSKGLFSPLYLMGSKCHLTWPMGPLRVVGPVWSLQTGLYEASCHLVWQNRQLLKYLNPLFQTFLRNYEIDLFSLLIMYSWYWDAECNWNPSPWMTIISLSYPVYTMAADDLVTEITRASAAMVLT